MNSTELAKYLEARSFPIALRNYVTQNLMVNKNYEPFSDLAERGEATVRFVWNGRTLKVSRVAPPELVIEPQVLIQPPQNAVETIISPDGNNAIYKVESEPNPDSFEEDMLKKSNPTEEVEEKPKRKRRKQNESNS